MNGVHSLAAPRFFSGTANAVAYGPDDEVGPRLSPPSRGDAPGSFGSVFRAELAQLDHSLKGAQRQSLLLAAGKAGNLHQVMLDIEQARIAFQLALQFRNRILDAVQDVQRMQL